MKSIDVPCVNSVTSERFLPSECSTREVDGGRFGTESAAQSAAVPQQLGGGIAPKRSRIAPTVTGARGCIYALWSGRGRPSV